MTAIAASKRHAEANRSAALALILECMVHAGETER
jgi:hypothetical protein